MDDRFQVFIEELNKLCEKYDATFERDDGRRGIYVYIGEENFDELPDKLYWNSR